MCIVLLRLIYFIMDAFAFYFFYVLLFFNSSSSGFPVDTLKNSKLPAAKVLDFMKQFGYLEEDDDSSASALYTTDGIAETIKTVQRYGALEETGILDNATLKLFTAPRCGVKDIVRKRSKRYALGPGAWNKRTITFFISNWSPRLSEETVAKYIGLALETWGKYAHLRFERVHSDDADIIVSFGRGYHGDSFAFDGPGNILAHAFFPNTIRDIGGDIHFDDDEDWSTPENGRDGVDFLSVALHELGHSLGLAHTPDSSAVMFPYYSGNEKGRELQLGYDDILGLYELYIQRNIDENVSEDESDETTRRQYTTRRAVTRTSTVGTTEYTSTVTAREVPTESTSTFVTESTTERMFVNYIGDTETVDDHKRHENRSTTEICEGYFDAVATLREELFIFKDHYVWRLKDLSQIQRGYPVEIHQMFPQLPKFIKKIDAAYERPDGMIVLFTDNIFWIFDGQRFIENSPRPLSDYGLPSTLDKIDAVQIWAKNGKTYLFARDRFWRYNETSKSMDEHYPRPISVWREIPEDLDAATTWKGVTYFFKAGMYWKLDNNWISATKESPLPSPQLWLGCPEDLRMMKQLNNYHK